MSSLAEVSISVASPVLVANETREVFSNSTVSLCSAYLSVTFHFKFSRGQGDYVAHSRAPVKVGQEKMETKRGHVDQLWRDSRPLLSIFFIFMQFWANITQNSTLASPSGKSCICHCRFNVSHFLPNIYESATGNGL